MRRFFRAFPLRLTRFMLRFMSVGTNLRLSTRFLLPDTYAGSELSMSLSVNPRPRLLSHHCKDAKLCRFAQLGHHLQLPSSGFCRFRARAFAWRQNG